MPAASTPPPPLSVRGAAAAAGRLAAVACGLTAARRPSSSSSWCEYAPPGGLAKAPWLGTAFWRRSCEYAPPPKLPHPGSTPYGVWSPNNDRRPAGQLGSGQARKAGRQAATAWARVRARLTRRPEYRPPGGGFAPLPLSPRTAGGGGPCPRVLFPLPPSPHPFATKVPRLLARLSLASPAG